MLIIPPVLGIALDHDREIVIRERTTWADWLAPVVPA
jgi:hypothetical protein